ncbi:Threonine synthase domain protein [Candidatus Omnitrophus magneticus]|uniref:Threonine synthase n=1 Tax=Candidatus Omnitrophus magneticus TaxID=1609969 RepID=A0A0F0CSM0_9BACT|nr:Threonine synthase domain protein [Candidatus Omnitrophus magneticus]
MGIIERYKKYLPVTDKTPIVSLEEGNTPLISAPVAAKKIGDGYNVWLKYEGLNPTGSFKDRGMTMAVSKALEEGAKAIVCASTGNTSAAAAAYAVRAGLKCVVIIPEGAIAIGKLAQSLIHGAKVIAVKGNFDDALKVVREISEKYPITLVNSVNPYRLEGQKTGSFEICDFLGKSPDFHVLPVGNAGNITAYWKGYKEYRAIGKITNLPKMMGFQAALSAPIVDGKIIEKPETIATAIRIGNPASWKEAVYARDESFGIIDKVTDEEIIDAYKFLASKVGVFAEPASSASIAGIFKKAKEGYFPKLAKGETKNIVCILTGHGLKDPDRAIKTLEYPVIMEPDVKKIAKEAGL